MKQDVTSSNNPNVELAVKELVSKLSMPAASYSIVIFFASTVYDFALLSERIYEQFPKAQVIGCSSAGEIGSGGFAKHTVVLSALYSPGSRTQACGYLLEGINAFPIAYKKEISGAANRAGINLASASCSKDAFAITLVCGLMNAEEVLLSLLYSIIKDPNFLIAGGSAGDDLAFKTTYVSYNGQCSSTAAVLLFVKTQDPFYIYKENIFKASGKSIALTEVDPKTHVVRSIDGKNPLQRYSEILGIDKSQAEKAILAHPFGRLFGDNMFIASLVRFNPDGTLPMYARVLQGDVQEILEPLDAVKVSQESCTKILEKVPKPGCVILFNCILRTLGFEQMNMQSQIAAVWKRNFPVFAGFSTYGEQFAHINSNQTLVTLVIGE